MAEPDKAAREYAMTLLSRRAYTQKGLYDKLLTRCDEHSAAAAVARMIELGLLDDADYARRYSSDLVKFKGMAASRVKMELARKGIDREIIDEVVSELDGDPQPAIAKVVKRRYMRYIGDEKGRAKTINALIRLGYRYGDIAAAIRNLSEDENYYDDWE